MTPNHFDTIFYASMDAIDKVSAKDIQKRQAVIEELNRQKIIFKSLFSNSSDAICLLDANQRILEINEVFTDMFGYFLSEIKGKKIDTLISNKEMVDENIELTQRMYHGEKIVLEGIRYDKDKKPVSVLVKGVPIVEGDEIIGGFGIYTDISDRKKAEEEILFISYHDPLTGLYNRRYFEEEMRRLEGSRCVPVSLIMGDVNGLKLTNDAFGHAFGDLLLERIATIISSTCRNNEIVARMGGDEFVIVLPYTDASAAKRIVERIKSTLKTETVNNIELSLSFGYSEKTLPNEPINQLLKRVEDHMYRNKLLESQLFKEKMFGVILESLHVKFPLEKMHAEKVAYYAALLGKALEITEHELEGLKKAAMLHDIGKIALSTSALDPNRSYKDSDWIEMKKHPEIGYRILNALNEMSTYAPIILSHHEWYDGSGYPKGLKANEIPLHSRIISIADAYQAMTSSRRYLPIYTPLDALEELDRFSGTQFDPVLVSYFKRIINNIC